MKIRILAALAALAAMNLACSDPQGGGTTTASTGLSASSGESGSNGSGSNGSGSVTGSTGASASNGSTATNGSNATTGTVSTGSSGTSGLQPTCIGGQACVYDNECGGSDTCLYHDGEPGCCVPTSNSCRNGSAVYGPCAPGWVADTGPDTGNTDCCVLADGGTGGGTTGGTGGTTGTCQFDGGISGGQCNPDCGHGFHCVGGECVLNGGNGPIQVTVRWGQPRDIDLHVVEPGGCEVYYGNRTCVGALDLDSNAGCGIDNVDVENVIYDPSVTPPSGTYTVRVADWSDCNLPGPIPYQVIIRHNGITDTYCNSFPAGSGHGGGAGTGQTIATFTYP